MTRQLTRQLECRFDVPTADLTLAALRLKVALKQLDESRVVARRCQSLRLRLRIIAGTHHPIRRELGVVDDADRSELGGRLDILSGDALQRQTL